MSVAALGALADARRSSRPPRPAAAADSWRSGHVRRDAGAVDVQPRQNASEGAYHARRASPSRATACCPRAAAASSQHQAGRLHAEQAGAVGRRARGQRHRRYRGLRRAGHRRGQRGHRAALRCQEEGANVFLADMQTYDEYDEYACDMACYNSKLFLDKGTPEIDTTEVFNEYMRLSRGHAHQKIVRDYAMRSGEMLDWMVGHIPAEYVEKYAKTSNYKGNDNFNGECCGQRSWPAMTQWRDEESNINMWPFVIRSVHAAFEEAGGTIKWGYQGVVLVQDGDAVTGAVFQDVDGAYHQINAKAGRGGGRLRRQPRHAPRPVRPDAQPGLVVRQRPHRRHQHRGSRDGSGIRMCMWPAARWRVPRAGQAAGINGVPGFAFAAHGRASATTASAS
ncbi:MAG: hypothetical protein ACLTMP_00755 [Eggerthella lenta]